MSTPSTTGQMVFDHSMQIIDSVNESTGSSDTDDNAAYEVRAVGLINILGGRLYKYSDNYTVATAGTRPIFEKITDLSDVVELDDYICESVLPFGLAALLLLDENQTLAGVCQQFYEDAVADLKLGIPTESEAITDYYDVGEEHNEYSAW